MNSQAAANAAIADKATIADESLPNRTASKAPGIGNARRTGRQAEPAPHTEATEYFQAPVEAARHRARQIIAEGVVGGYTRVIEDWQQREDGQIGFTIRTLPAPCRPPAQVVTMLRLAPIAAAVPDDT